MNTTGARSEYVGWTNTPFRSTSDILFGCVSTLVLCVYTALHMNIPLCNESKGSNLRNHAMWICTGIFMPELVLTAAITEHVVATKLRHRLEERHKPGMLPEGEQDKRWREIFSYFVLMGGYQLVHEVGEQRLAVRLQPDWVLKLLSRKDFEPARLSDIRDRSKASTLAKILSAVQSSYLALRIVARLSQKLPVTELEVHTVAHILCALASWVAWLRKPYNIDRPQEIKLESDLGGFTAMSWILESEKGRQQRALTGIISNLNMGASSADTVVIEGYTSKEDLRVYQQKEHSMLVVLLDLPALTLTETDTMFRNLDEVFGPDQQQHVLVVERCWGTSRNRFKTGPTVATATWRQPQALHSCIEVNAWAYHLHRRFWTDPNLHDILRSIAERSTADNSSLSAQHRGIFFAADGALSINDIWVANGINMVGVLLVAISALYGVMHAAFWRARFPTELESWLWRISSVIVGTMPIFIWLAAITSGREIGCTYWAIYIVAMLVLPSARAFLVVEAFISLRSQPVEVYRQVNWTQWIPHI